MKLTDHEISNIHTSIFLHVASSLGGLPITNFQCDEIFITANDSGAYEIKFILSVNDLRCACDCVCVGETKREPNYMNVRQGISEALDILLPKLMERLQPKKDPFN